MLDVVDDGFNGFVGQTGIENALRQDGGTFIAPAEFQDETVPHVALFVSALRAAGVGPREHLLVRAADQGALPQVGVADSEEATAAAIEDEELGVAEIA